MSIFYPLEKTIGGFCNPCSLRIIPKLDITISDLKPMEVVISKDYQMRETLVGKPLSTGKTRYEGKLYLQILKLKISKDFSKDISSKEKGEIIDFVSNYGRPYGIEEASAHMRSDPNISYFGNGDKINWVFMNFISAPQDHHRVSYFYEFRAMYVDFLDIYEIIKSGNLHRIDQYKDSTNFEKYRGVFNNALSESQLYLQSMDEVYKTTWISKSCISQCYLELYDLIMTNQKIKVCKYCGSDFESSKSNEVRCNNCRQKFIYRKMYYQKNIQTEREKAKSRMAKKRLLSS